MLNSKYNSRKGVTLTELSISVAIVSVLIAGTFGGVTMLKAAKIRKIVNELSSYMAAVNEFQSQYSYLPGDMPTASNYWTGAHNGNGNTTIDTVNEDLYVWEHLGDAKLIGGTYTGAVSGTRYAARVNAPNSEPYISGVFSFYTVQTLIYNTAGHAIQLGSIVSGWPNGGVMLAKDSSAIDVKVDDGLASSGMLYAVRTGASGCTDADSSAASANYILSDGTATCKLYYWQNKF